MNRKLIVAGLLALVPELRATDWLLDPTPFRAAITTNANEVALENGLVRRVIRLAPNAATTRFDNLMTGNNLLRAVRPEALVELDGVKYKVGGLDGQPVHNYLDPRWLDTMTADPAAFRFTGYRVGPTVARFPWQPRREWMPAELPWPPPGRALTLSFAAPAAMSVGAGAYRELWTDDFIKLAPEWKVALSGKHPRTSFQNEGKVGELMAHENTFAFAERAWLAGAVAAQARVDPGTDRSASWGPGLALVYPDAVVKLYLRTGKGAFGMSLNGSDGDIGKLKDGQSYVLRLRVLPGRVVGEASADGKTWEQVGAFNVQGQPRAVRIGKMDRGGGASDYNVNGNLERCQVQAFRFLAEDKTKAVPAPALAVDMHYEIFDGLPLVSKWLTVRNGTDKPVRLNTFISEILAAVEPESIVDDSPSWQLPNLLVETDYTFGGMSGPNHGAGVHWVADPDFPTQVNYNRKTPCLLECRPPLGPDQLIPPGGTFESFRAFELVQDSTDRERQSLALRRMYRTIAPWVTENPVLMHVRSSQPEAVKLAVDQCAAVGFEMVIMTFGSGFNYESRDPKYQAQIKELAAYARSKGVALGGYSLLASRGAGTKSDNTQGAPPRFGVMPCLGAQWGVDYLAQLKHFIATAGLGVLEHDGSYPGDCCAATNHPFHRGLADSQWVMWKAITEFYQWCRARGVYLNIPDWYFLNGGTKTGMGYRETNWSLPRAYQEIIERQNIFDGTWEKTPSMGWMFVPLTQYHGGGAAATIEPLKDHLPHYGQRLANLFGAGVQACYRGPRLFDAPETEAVVKKWVSFYKRHRAILDSDLIHLRRADGQDLDYILHVNPTLKEKGLLMVYNPLAQPVSKTLTVPLYYTGLTNAARIREQEGTAKKYSLDRAFNVNIPVTVPANSCTWLVIE